MSSKNWDSSFQTIMLIMYHFILVVRQTLKKNKMINYAWNGIHPVYSISNKTQLSSNLNSSSIPKQPKHFELCIYATLKRIEKRKLYDDYVQLCWIFSLYFLQSSIASQYKNTVLFKGNRYAASGHWTAAYDFCAEFAWAMETWSWSRGTASLGACDSLQPSQPPPWLSV